MSGLALGKIGTKRAFRHAVSRKVQACPKGMGLAVGFALCAVTAKKEKKK